MICGLIVFVTIFIFGYAVVKFVKNCAGDENAD